MARLPVAQSKTALRQARRAGGVDPFPGGLRTAAMDVEAGEPREEIRSGLTKAKAIEFGVALQNRMAGGGWKLRVWQNLGWHYNVRRGALTVNISTPAGRGRAGGLEYWTLLGDGTDDVGGQHYWHDTAHFKDPNLAVRNQVKVARQFIARCIDVVNGAEGTS